MAKETIEVSVNHRPNILKLARLTIKLLAVLDFITFGAIHDRLVFQGEKVVDLYKQYLKIEVKK